MTHFNKKAICAAVGSAVAFAAIGSGVAIAQDAEAAIVEELVVTGSRIKRSELDSSTPLEIMTAIEMEAQGRFTLADALRNSTSNQFGSFNQRSGSTSQSQATISLLGAGSNRTLVLMDGIRLPGSPSLGGTAVNLNTIPAAMIERVEIVKDGGSAIYGSDAIAGVVNIILKDNYEGVTISGGKGFTSLEGAETQEFSIVAGVSNDRGNITMAFETQSQDPIFDVDRPYTAARMEDLNGDGMITRAVETDGISNFGATIVNPFTGQLEASPQCADLTANVPGFVGVLDEPGNGGESCGFAYANVSANMASTERNSVVVNASYEVSDNIELFSRLMVVHNQSFGRYAPPAAPFPLIPANTPHNPYSEDTSGRFRWYQLGNRASTVDDYTQDYLLGFRGETNDIDWEVYYHTNQTDNKKVGNTFLSITGLITNLYYGTAFDSDAGLGALSATALLSDQNQFDQWYAGAGFELGELGGGAISHYIGGETFDIEYSSTVDRQSEAGWVGGSSGNSSGAARKVKAVFYEAALPVADNLDVSIAARYDDYDDFGSQVSPKVSVSWRPMEDLLLRASWGEGFRAPTLSELTQADAFSASFATDYVQCQNDSIPFDSCPEQQFTDTIQSNANLQPESSEFINLGAVWTPHDDWSVQVDYFDLTVDDVIQTVDVQDLIFGELVGITGLDPSLRLIRQPNGAIDETFTGSVNGPGFAIQGLDINVKYNHDYSFGTLSADWQISNFLAWENSSFFGGPLQDQAGWGLQPDLVSQFTLGWSDGPHALTWNMDYKASTFEDELPVIVEGQTPYLEPQGNLDSFLIHNLTYSYDAGDWGRYGVAIRNVTEEEPILDSLGTYPPGHFNLYSQGHIGRVVSVTATISF
jgi:iron complex outermembrane receptor protein